MVRGGRDQTSCLGDLSPRTCGRRADADGGAESEGESSYFFRADGQLTTMVSGVSAACCVVSTETRNRAPSRVTAYGHGAFACRLSTPAVMNWPASRMSNSARG